MATFIKAGFWEKLCQKCTGYKGWLNLDEFVKQNSGGNSYKVYTALLEYTSDSLPPTPTVLENTIGNIVWTKSATGQYDATLTGAFPVGKTFVLYTHDQYNGMFAICGAMRESDNVVRISVSACDSCSDVNLIAGIDSIEIRVYP